MPSVTNEYVEALKKRYSNYESFKKNAGKREVIDIVPICNSVNGDFKEVQGLETVIRSIINLLLIPKRTYPFDPEFGSKIFNFIFEPLDDIMLDSLKKELADGLSNEEDRCKFKIDISKKGTSKDKKVNVIVTISYKDQKKKVYVPISEEYLKSISSKHLGDI